MESKLIYKRLIFCILVVASFTFSSESCAQSKPKRDTSKDKSVILERKKKESQKKNVAATQRNNGRKRRYKSTPNPTLASFLRVNQLSYIWKKVNSYGGVDIYEVNTDGKDWTIWGAPSWCHITKYPSSFWVSYDSNPSHEDRYDWFRVRVDTLEVKVDIKQEGLPLNIRAEFNNGSILHNYNYCLKINSSVTIRGAKNQKCLICAYFTDEDNNMIKAEYNYSKYATPATNDLFTATEIIPTTDDAQTFNVVLYLPNNAMMLHKKKNTIKCQLFVYCEKTSSFLSDTNYTMVFKATKKKGNITTKSL